MSHSTKAMGIVLPWVSILSKYIQKPQLKNTQTKLVNVVESLPNGRVILQLPYYLVKLSN